MKKIAYASLIRRIAREQGVPINGLDDDQIIEFYENSMWGTMTILRLALRDVLSPTIDHLRSFVEKFTKEEVSEDD